LQSVNVQLSGRVPVSKSSNPTSTRVQNHGVGVTLGVVVGVTLGVGVILGVDVGVTNGVGVIGVAVGDGDGVDVFSGVRVGVADGVGVTLEVGVGVTEGGGVRVTLGVGVGVIRHFTSTSSKASSPSPFL